MIVQKINYEQLFPTGQYQNVKLGMEIILDGTDTAEAYESAKKLINESFSKLFPPLTVNPEWVTNTANYPMPEQLPEIHITSKESAIQNMINAINSCTEVKTLETYKLLVRNNPVFQDAYNKKMEAL